MAKMSHGWIKKNDRNTASGIENILDATPGRIAA
jgi:hypothetical protein